MKSQIDYPSPNGAGPGREAGESEEVFRAIFEQSMDGMLLADSETRRFVRSNRSIQRLLGYTGEELLGLSVADIHPPAQLTRVLDQFERQAEGIIGGGPDTPVRRKDGSVFYADISATPIRLKGRNYLLGTFHDISEHKHVLQALRDNEHKYRTLFESADDAILLMDRDRFIDCNARTLTLFGCTREQIIGEAPYRFSPPTQPDGRNSTEMAREKIDKAVNEGPQFFEWDHWRADQTPFAAEVSLNRLELGGKLLLQAIVRDISRRKRGEAQLKESLFFLTRAQEVAHMGSYKYDLLTGLWTGSPQLDEIFGIGPDYPRDLAGWEALLAPVDRQRMSRYMSRYVLAERNRFDKEYRIVRRSDGQERWVSGLGELTADASGKLLMMIGTIQDITERKEAQNRLRQIAIELVRSNRDLEQFAYVSSHDLKEPLRMVTGFMSLLKDRCRGSLDETALEYIGYAEEGGMRMQRLVEDLLAYSRIGRNSLVEPVDMDMAADEALKNLRAPIAEAGAVITREPLPVVQAGHLEMIRLFQNLIGNAIKFRREGVAPVIHLAARREGGRWLFQVKDNGIGIAPEYRKRVFLIFQRLHVPEKYPGTGIGLAICKKIVERHGGKIWVDSNEEGGSTFCFTIGGADKNS